ncbi:hypothetical protein HMPREF1617_05101 [Escherichia coli 908675]|nr:hypothetical protein HMPREF1617_05101 [Escherichia coli 908675]
MCRTNGKAFFEAISFVLSVNNIQHRHNSLFGKVVKYVILKGEDLQRKDDVFVKTMHKVRSITPKMTFSLILIVLPY